MVNTIDQILAHFNQGKFQEALEGIYHYLPNNEEEKNKLDLIKAAVYLRSGAVDAAIQLIEDCWQNQKIHTAELYNLKGIAFRSKNKLSQAIDIFTEGFEKHPSSVDLAHNLSLTATDLAQYNKGIEYAKKALAINPRFKETLKNLARIHITQRNVKKAEEVFTKLRELKETGLDVLVGEGALDLIANKPHEAAKKFKKALKTNPKAGPALANLGICCKFMGDYDSAKKYLVQACECEPDQIEHPWNLAIVQLALGEFEEGWKGYEVRYDPKRIATDRVLMPNTPVPMLKPGDSVKGKSVVLLQEQGFGDTFQFFRFTQYLKDEGAREIIAIVSKDLMGVIKTIPWIDRVQNEMKAAERLPDYWVFAMSLPYRYQLKTVSEIPAPTGYMKLERYKFDQWQTFFQGYRKKIRVGLIWAGRESHSNDENRSMELKTLKRLAKFQKQIDFFSLQKGSKQNQEPGVEWHITRLGDQLSDFTDTAAVFSQIDLLISIDSGPIHLAGAMGMPVWALIPKVFDFRWLIDREDTPWYPSMRLFRQKKGEKWPEVIERMEKALEEFITKYQGRWQPDIIESVPKAFTSPMVGGTRFYNECAYEQHLQKNWPQAISMYQMTLRYEPENIDARRNLASAYRSNGQLTDALQIYQTAENDGAKDSLLYSNYANLLIEKGDTTKALEKIEKALAIDPHNQAAQKLQNQLKPQLASQNIPERDTQTSQSIEDSLKKIWGLTFSDQLPAARELLQLLIDSRPLSVEICIMAGIVYQESKEYELAEEYYQKAINIQENFPEIYVNQAVLFAKQLKYQQAITAVNRCIALNPNHAEAHFHKSLYLLTLGQYKEGWKEYEWRMDDRRTAPERIRKPQLSMPMWQGEDLRGKRILLMPEQGYGDYIQFIRFAKNLKKMGAIVVAGTRMPLLRVLSTCPWADEVVTDGERVAYHFWTFPMSLPYQLGIDEEGGLTPFPYLFPIADKIEYWKNILSSQKIELNQPIVAINWTGSKTHIRDQFRNVNFAELATVFTGIEIQCIAINKDCDFSKEYQINNKRIFNAGEFIQDFSDTAAIISLVDLVISIDSAPAHLAGAMGKDCWTLLDYLPDFRWGLDKAQTNWYPSLKLYRKAFMSDWSEILDILNRDLKNRYQK